MIERSKATQRKSNVAAIAQPFILLMQTATLVCFQGTAVSPRLGGQPMTVGDRLSLAFSASSALAPVRAHKPVSLMNEFLNFITYDRHTAERKGPHGAAKGITSHVF